MFNIKLIVSFYDIMFCSGGYIVAYHNMIKQTNGELIKPNVICDNSKQTSLSNTNSFLNNMFNFYTISCYTPFFIINLISFAVAIAFAQFRQVISNLIYLHLPLQSISDLQWHFILLSNSYSRLCKVSLT